MHYHVSIIAALGAFISLVSSECCGIDDPIASFRQCSPVVVAADAPFLVKAINYTRYHDDLGGGRYNPDPSWNSISVSLARYSNRVCDADVTGCAVSGPVCRLIDCFPLSQDASRATNNGGSLISDFIVSIPAGAGPDGAWYDLASSQFDRQDGTQDLTQSVWRRVSRASNASSLEYDNNYYGFNMTGMQKQEGTGDDGFYPFEVADYDTWPMLLRGVPCRAYACARQCVHKAWSVTSASVDYDAAMACIDQCEGVDDVVNYCPDVGGESLTVTPEVIGLASQSALDSYVPDGCAKYESVRGSNPI